MNIELQIVNNSNNSDKWITLPMDHVQLMQELKAMGDGTLVIGNINACFDIQNYSLDDIFKLNDLMSTANGLNEKEINAVLNVANCDIEGAINRLKTGVAECYHGFKTIKQFAMALFAVESKELYTDSNMDQPMVMDYHWFSNFLITSGWKIDTQQDIVVHLK